MTCSVIEGHFKDMSAHSQAAHQTVTTVLEQEKVKGFAEVLISEDITQGICHLCVPTRDDIFCDVLL